MKVLNFFDIASGQWNNEKEGMTEMKESNNFSQSLPCPLLTVGCFHLPGRPSVPDEAQPQLSVQTLEVHVV